MYSLAVLGGNGVRAIDRKSYTTNSFSYATNGNSDPANYHSDSGHNQYPDPFDYVSDNHAAKHHPDESERDNNYNTEHHKPQRHDNHQPKRDKPDRYDHHHAEQDHESERHNTKRSTVLPNFGVDLGFFNLLDNVNVAFDRYEYDAINHLHAFVNYHDYAPSAVGIQFADPRLAETWVSLSLSRGQIDRSIPGSRRYSCHALP